MQSALQAGNVAPLTSTNSASKTWQTAFSGPASRAPLNACLVYVYPAGPGLGSCFALGDKPRDVGREPDCDICIDDSSVSRRHVRIQPEADGYAAVDLQSTNGTYVNDQPISVHKLQDGDYLRIGNCIYRFLAGGNLEAEYYEEIYRLTIIDPVTETYNRRYLLEFLERELSRAARYQRPLALVLLDIDLFKKINDELGHVAGDYTLRELSICIRSAVRKEELFARYGGEEFAVGLVETTAEGAVVEAERLRAVVEQHPFQYENQSYPVTISLGVAATSGGEHMTPTELIQQADSKLCQAKRQGRNCVVA
jgi:diguanylate cyclase (GGDEF)-like protein